MRYLLFCPRGPPAPRRREFGERLLFAACGCDLGGKVGFLLLDSLTESIAHKSGDLYWRADLALSFLDRLGDRFSAIVDESLLEEANLLVVGLQAGIDDLLDDVLGLALLAIFVGQHVLLAPDE